MGKGSLWVMCVSVSVCAGMIEELQKNNQPVMS